MAGYHRAGIRLDHPLSSEGEGVGDEGGEGGLLLTLPNFARHLRASCRECFFRQLVALARLIFAIYTFCTYSPRKCLFFHIFGPKNGVKADFAPG